MDRLAAPPRAPPSPDAARATRSRDSGRSARSSRAIARSRCAWPRPIGLDTKSARGCARAAPRARRFGRPRARAEELVEQQVDRDRVAGLRAVAGALERDELAARRARRVPRRARSGDDPGRPSPCDDEHRARDPRAQLEHLLPRQRLRRRAASRSASRRPSRAPHPTQSSICFVECGSVKHLREEELDEARVVAPPVVRVVLLPALVGLELVVASVERGDDPAPARWTRTAPMNSDAVDAAPDARAARMSAALRRRARARRRTPARCPSRRARRARRPRTRRSS